MEKYAELLIKAKNRLVLSEHMINKSYPLVSNPKFFLDILETILETFSFSLNSLLEYYEEKNVFDSSEKFSKKIKLIEERSYKKYEIKPEVFQTILEIENLVEMYQKSPVVFTRKEKLVICDDEYKAYIVDAEMISRYIKEAKLFIQQVYTKVSKNERIIR